MRKFLTTLCGALLLLSAIAFAGSTESNKSDPQKFIGTWKLVNTVRPGGSPNLMLGKNPVEYLVYTKEGLMTGHLMRRHRPKFHSNDVNKASIKETKNFLADYLAYAGPFKVDTKRKVVIHHPMIHFSPNSVGKTLERSYRFKGNDLLYLTAIELHPKLTFIFKRIKTTVNGKPLPNNPDCQRFIGAWKLVKTYRADNGAPNLIYGKDPRGYLVYTKEGLVSAHLMRRQRIIFHGDNVKKATPEESATLLHDYMGYTGDFTIDPKNKIVKHHPAIHTFPNSIDKYLPRSYKFKGDNLLYLQTVGRTPALVFVWERIRK